MAGWGRGDWGYGLAQRHRGLEESTERVNIAIPSDVSFALFQGNIYDIIMTMLADRLLLLLTCLMKNEATKREKEDIYLSVSSYHRFPAVLLKLSHRNIEAAPFSLNEEEKQL